MAVEQVDPGAAAPCPYLGLRDDPATRYAFPSGGQRCHARRRPAGVVLAKQEADCLTTRHVACRRYRPPATATGSPSARLGRGGRLAQGLRGVARIVMAGLLLALAALLGVLLGGAMGQAVPG